MIVAGIMVVAVVVTVVKGRACPVGEESSKPKSPEPKPEPPESELSPSSCVSPSRLGAAGLVAHQREGGEHSALQDGEQRREVASGKVEEGHQKLEALDGSGDGGD